MPNLYRFNFSHQVLPYLPLELSREEKKVAVIGLLDTGSTVNVLPYHMGAQLGLVWEEQTTVLELAGNLRDVEARGILLNATIGQFSDIRLAFAWTQSSDVPVILGHINFFRTFEVCIYSSQSYVELRLASD
jgi:hypothetical protein